MREMRITWIIKMVDINIPDPNKEGELLSYSLDKKMARFLDKVKNKITKKDKDYVMLIDGYEGSGKSVAAQQWGKYVDNTLCLERICMTAEEFREAILKATRGQCVIYDEAVTGMTSGDSIARIGKILKSLMMQMRQNNLFVIVIIPTIFELNKYSVLSRARSFFHIYEKGDKMGYWVGYNRKDTRLVYLKGKKTYSYRVKSRFIGRFYGKYVVNEEQYRDKKRKALAELEKDEKKGQWGKSIWFNQLSIMFWLCNQKTEKKVTMDYMSDLLKRCGFPLSKPEISERIAKVERNINGTVRENGEKLIG